MVFILAQSYFWGPIYRYNTNYNLWRNINVKKIYNHYNIYNFDSIIKYFFIKENLKYEVNRDKTFKFPNGKHQITLRYDYASRPYVFKNGKLIYKYDGPGFNETVDWYIKWLSENEILLYYHSSNERYNEEYHIIID